MVEQNAIRGVYAVGFAVIYRDPIRVELCRRIGRARVERCRLSLRDFLHLAEQLGRRSLIETGFIY